MKKFFIFVLTFAFSFGIFAQENQPELSKGQMYRKKLVEMQDEMLDFLLQIPQELRQYIFPMLNEQQSVPKKIKTHPEIIVWKGKKPTRIAKKFQNDKEFLEYLPAQYYFYLSPDMWPDEAGQKTGLEANPNRVMLNFMKASHTDNFLSEDLLNFKNSLITLNQYLTPEQREILSQKDSPVYLSKLIFIPNIELDTKLQKTGAKSVQDFAKRVDKIAFIYRQYKKGIPPQESSKDIEFVQTYFSLIPVLFKNTNFEVLLDKTLYSD